MPRIATVDRRRISDDAITSNGHLQSSNEANALSAPEQNSQTAGPWEPGATVSGQKYLHRKNLGTPPSLYYPL